MYSGPECKECKFKSPATQLLNDEQLNKLDKNCAEVDLDKGEVIFRQGMLSSNIIYLKEGIVKLHVQGPNKEQIMKITKGPVYLGIPTTFDEKFNRYSATTVSKSNACYVNIEIFKHFVQDNGHFAFEIIVELCRNEINMFNKCINRAQKNARGRIADALIFFSEQIFENHKFELPLTREEIGNYIDTTRESVSRILAEFSNEKIIILQNKKVEIINIEQLKLISKTG